MERVIGATEARVHFGKWMRHVRAHGGVVIVQRAGQTEAVLLSAETYERLAGRAQRASPTPLERAAALRAQILARRGGALVPPPEEVMRSIREERDRDLAPVR
ncbi:type II toxin-antitoxin system Phd/YefM family antitoxin [Deferrisoma camini]|uniref:type II toxin-antitoxin system Phd/YefM family antitoxin n=1 Tax=Deferrisoma camini TaxID=1035120 RepID=UPI00046D5747|nr:type II toxin-antitoxin system Phd/YefM family antitoxin [Deferrisoma camini]